MKNLTDITINMFSGATASLITFLSLMLGIRIMSPESYSIIGIWLTLLAGVQILDFGLLIAMQRSCSRTNDIVTKNIIVEDGNFLFILLTIILMASAILIPTPEGSAYNQLNKIQWILLLCAVILNLLVNYHQAAFVSLDKHKENAWIQVVISIVRTTIPIFIYYLSSSFTLMIATCVLTSLSLVIVMMKANNINIININLGIQSIKNQLRKSKALLPNLIPLYLSTIAPAILSVIDRTWASQVFSAVEFAAYFSSFMVASLVNISVLPFVKVATSRMINMNYETNYKLVKTFTEIMSYFILLMIFVFYIYQDTIIKLIFHENEAYPINTTFIISLMFSFWGAAMGWILALLTQFYFNTSSQIKLLGITLGLYIFTRQILHSHTIWLVASVWYLHGIIQIILVPIIYFNESQQSFVLVLDWFKRIIFLPLLYLTGSLIAYLFVLKERLFFAPLFLVVLFFCLYLFSRRELKRLNVSDFTL